MNLQKMDHVAIIVGDYEKSKHFYVDLLGFPILRENYRPERNDWVLSLKFGDSELELFGMQNCPERPTHPEAKGLRHLAFRVDSVEQTVRELEALGIPCEAVRLDTFTGKKLTFFKDPDGLPLEIHE